MHSLETSDSQLENSCSNWRGFANSKRDGMQGVEKFSKGAEQFEAHELLNQSGEAFFEENSYPEGTYYMDKRQSTSKWRRGTGEGAFKK